MINLINDLMFLPVAEGLGHARNSSTGKTLAKVTSTQDNLFVNLYMNMATKSASSSVAADPVTAALQKLLADSYALMAQTHLAHWNVEGTDFFQLHVAFQSQYEELFTAVDDIAERVRGLGGYAEGGLERLAQLSDLSTLPVGRLPAKDFVAHLIEGHEKVSASAKAVETAAGEADDLETQDLAIGRRRVHQKTLWMLNSFLK